MVSMEKREQIARELAQGRQAREQGLEGRARVCARRAVGIALRHYYSLRDPRLMSLSVVDLVQTYQEQPGLPQNLRDACAYLLTRVDPDYNLPLPVDLLAEAEVLIEAILEDDNHS